MNAYIGEDGIVVGVELRGNSEKCCNVENIWGPKPFINVYSQVLGLGWCLVWPHCTHVYHAVSKVYSFRSHIGLWNHNVTQSQEGP